jgi:thioredoxin-like negative regulator of GroEL
MDGNRKVHAAYHVRSIPSVVIIGRDGVIAKHFLGTRSEEDLRAALDSAAVKR